MVEMSIKLKEGLNILPVTFKVKFMFKFAI